MHTNTKKTQCVSPYIGDGDLCVLDSDADNYPDLALRTCKDTETHTYCSTDTCPNAPNPDQTDITPCRGNITGILPALWTFGLHDLSACKVTE